MPESAIAAATAASRRLARVLHNIGELPRDIDSACAALLRHLERDWPTYQATALARSDLQLIVTSDGIGYVTRLESIHHDLGALLADLAHLIALTVTTSPPVEIALPDGRLTAWLSQQPIDLVPRRDDLRRELEDVQSWIAAAMAIGAELQRECTLTGLQHVRVPVTLDRASVAASDELPPLMPDGQALEAYALELRERLCELISAVVPLLPGVTPGMHLPWKNARHLLVSGS